eukprot:scaffold114_cov361-Pinguiococcus_pyrenoidosus.AAC.47
MKLKKLLKSTHWEDFMNATAFKLQDARAKAPLTEIIIIIPSQNQGMYNIEHCRQRGLALVPPCPVLTRHHKHPWKVLVIVSNRSNVPRRCTRGDSSLLWLCIRTSSDIDGSLCPSISQQSKQLGPAHCTATATRTEQRVAHTHHVERGSVPLGQGCLRKRPCSRARTRGAYTSAARSCSSRLTLGQSICHSFMHKRDGCRVVVWLALQGGDENGSAASTGGHKLLNLVGTWQDLAVLSSLMHGRIYGASAVPVAIP